VSFVAFVSPFVLLVVAGSGDGFVVLGGFALASGAAVVKCRSSSVFSDGAIIVSKREDRKRAYMVRWAVFPGGNIRVNSIDVIVLA